VRVAGSPADAVRGATRVHLVLKDDAIVDDVIAALRPGLDRAPSSSITPRRSLSSRPSVRIG